MCKSTNSNMNVMFTGSITKDEKFKNSILDGENIKHRKDGGLMNLFASFDIYYSHGKYVGYTCTLSRQTKT